MAVCVGCDAALAHLVGVQPSVDTVRDNGLARFEGQLPAVEVNVHDVWLERQEPRHARHLGPCLDVGPGGTLVLPDDHAVGPRSRCLVVRVSGTSAPPRTWSSGKNATG